MTPLSTRVLPLPRCVRHPSLGAPAEAPPTNRRRRPRVLSYTSSTRWRPHRVSTRAAPFFTLVIKSGRSGPNTIHGCFGPVYMEPRGRGRSFVSRARARMECAGRDGIHAFVCRRRARRRTERRNDRDNRDRSHRTRLSRHSLSRVVIDRFERRIHSFIHSFIRARPSVANERTKGRRDEGTKGRPDERERSRERRERRDDRRVRSHRATRGAHVSNARRIERIESRARASF